MAFFGNCPGCGRQQVDSNGLCHECVISTIEELTRQLAEKQAYIDELFKERKAKG